MFWTILQIVAHILAILYENSHLYRMNGRIFFYENIKL